VPAAVAAVPAIVVGVHPVPAGAGVSVASDGSRVVVTGYRAGGEDHYRWTTSSPGRTVVCRELVSETNGAVLVEGVGSGLTWPPIDPGRTPRWSYWLDCRYGDGTPVELGSAGLGYVYADEITDFDAIVRTLAASYLGVTTGPAIGIGASPPAGLVGVEQWFWVEGYDGSPLRSVHDAVGHRVELELSLSTVRWSYGDGAVVATGPEGLGVRGASGPAAHRYRVRSTRPDVTDGTYPVTAELAFAVAYRLDGGPLLDAGLPVEVSTSRSLVVREAQAVAHRSQGP